MTLWRRNCSRFCIVHSINEDRNRTSPRFPVEKSINFHWENVRSTKLCCCCCVKWVMTTNCTSFSKMQRRKYQDDSVIGARREYIIARKVPISYSSLRPLLFIAGIWIWSKNNTKTAHVFVHPWHVFELPRPGIMLICLEDPRYVWWCRSSVSSLIGLKDVA